MNKLPIYHRNGFVPNVAATTKAQKMTQHIDSKPNASGIALSTRNLKSKLSPRSEESNSRPKNKSLFC